MEYPPLVAGQTARFAVHLTQLARLSARSNAGRPRIEMTPEARRPGRRAAGIGAAPAGRVSRRGQAAGRPDAIGGRCVVDAPGTRPIATTSARSRCSPTQPRRTPTAEKRAREGPGGHRLSEGTAVDQPVCHGAGARGATCATSIRVPAAIEPDDGRRGDRRRAGRGTVRGRRAAVDRRSRVTPGQVLGRLEPRLADAATIARRWRPRWPRRRRRSRRRAPNRRAPSGCWPSAPSRRVASKTPAAPSTVAEARLRAAEARLAQRDETLRTGGGPRRATPSCCARPSPAASPR